ncbi:MAG TPA: formyltetrahydrofolate deformylase [Actinomycetales bacterium]|nr:formyltetrahydrofolate deformylase [Actinomycetales bacterium]
MSVTTDLSANRTITHWVVTLACPDRPGIVAAVAGAIADLDGNITESQQFDDPVKKRFFMRVQFEAQIAREKLMESLAAVARDFQMDWHLDVVKRPVRTIVMVSKAAHCLNDLLFRQHSQRLPIDVVAVVGNHRDLEHLAEFYEVPFHYVPVTRDTKDEAEGELRRLIAELDTELVVLARYMQILSDSLCSDFAGRIINIHHSFLPSFKGARPYHQAYDRGVKLIGATAHYVTADLDEGPIIEQDVERVDHAHAVEEMVSLGEDVERRALARAVQWHAEHRVLLDGHRTIVFR